MTNAIERRLADLGIVLPKPAAPVANYVPWTISGNTLYVSGQIPVVDGKPLAQGQLGGAISLEQGVACARQCGINAIAQIKDACGDLSRVRRILKVTGFVNCSPGWAEIPKVVNGASDLFVAVFGDAGKHARSAVGAAGLPLGVPVEVETIVELS